MRQTRVLLAGRPVLPTYLHLKEYFPLTLKNSLSGKGERSRGNGCVHEISLLLSCLRDSEYSESVCAKELNVYRQCVEHEKVNQAEFKEAMKTGRLKGDGASQNLTFQQLNGLFTQWPQPSAKIGRTERRPPDMSYSDPLLKK